MIVVVSDGRVDVGMARNLGLPHQHPQRSFPISCSRGCLQLSLLLLVLLLLLLRLLSQMLSSSQLATVVYDARPVAPGTQRTPLVSPK